MWPCSFWLLLWNCCKEGENVNSLLSGSFPIKFSSLSAPTKIEELTARSDEKTQRSPVGNRTQGLSANSSRTFFVWSDCQFFYFCRSWKRREFEGENVFGNDNRRDSWPFLSKVLPMLESSGVIRNFQVQDTEQGVRSVLRVCWPGTPDGTVPEVPSRAITVNDQAPLL